MSRWYDLFTGSEKRFTDISMQMLDVKPNESILEIGCGTGHALAKFFDKGGKIVAIDISEKMLKVARKKNKNRNIGLCQADGLSLPFPKEQFDNVLSLLRSNYSTRLKFRRCCMRYDAYSKKTEL